MYRRALNVFAIVVLANSLMSLARADSVRAECGFATTATAPRSETSACMFSQRQGYIYISVDGGPEINLKPVEETPGNYVDEDGQPVYRRSGLGEQGVIFALPDRFLFVYWARDLQSCDGTVIASPAGCRIAYGELVFNISATNSGSINKLIVGTSGLEADNLQFKAEIDGTAYKTEIADLDSDGWPEIYIYVSSAGSGSYGSLVAYAVNNGKSMTPVYLAPVADNAAARDGYMGHDEFAVVENRLVQRFPIYLQGDTNAAPSGGMRQLQYRLNRGEAGWLLAIDKIVEY
jgi:hypothetical protein